jgi:hypothetical protein
VSYNCGGTGLNNCTRDPSIGKFGSKWIVVHTLAFNASDVAQFGMTILSSLTNPALTATQFISTSSFSGTLRAWAPEWFKNPDGTVYTDGGGCPHLNVVLTDGSTTFRDFELHPTNNCSDPSTAGTTWSTPALVSIDTETNRYLDPFTVCLSPSGGACNGTGDTFYHWYVHLVDSTTEYIQYAKSSTLAGPYTRQSPGGNWLGFTGVTQEGPMLVCADRPFVAPCSDWRLFYDKIPGVPGEIREGQINFSDSLNSWISFAAENPIVTDIQAKHGTVIPVP